MIKLFGMQLGSNSKAADPNRVVRSFVPPDNDDAAKEIGGGNIAGAFHYSLDLDKGVTNQAALINEYRGTSQIPQVSQAIEDIVSEGVITDSGQPVELVLDETPISEDTKKIFHQAFDKVMTLLKFSSRGNDLFRRWYIDGQINYHVLIDENNPRDGIQELRFVDPRNLIKVREYKNTDNIAGPMEYISLRSEKFIEYWIYSDSGFQNQPTVVGTNISLNGMKIAKDSIAHCNSGQVDPSSKLILSYLHVAVRIARQLRMLEDSLIIYRVSRASEKRIFYIDLQGLPKGRAEQYMQSIIAKYKNKISYDAQTGDLQTARNHQSITEDIWLPRRNGQDGTKIETLPAGSALGVVADVEYFQQNLYKALHVPVSRIDSQNAFLSNPSGLISRDEMKYSRFIDRLRARFSALFEELLKSELKLTGVINEDEWQVIRGSVKYDYKRDNHFTELAETQMLMSRMQAFSEVVDSVGTYFSEQWVKKNILKLTDEEIEAMRAEIFAEVETNSEMEAEKIKIKEKYGLVTTVPETGQIVPVAAPGVNENHTQEDSGQLDMLIEKIISARPK